EQQQSGGTHDAGSDASPIRASGVSPFGLAALDDIDLTDLRPGGERVGRRSGGMGPEQQAHRRPPPAGRARAAHASYRQLIPAPLRRMRQCAVSGRSANATSPHCRRGARSGAKTRVAVSGLAATTGSPRPPPAATARRSVRPPPPAPPRSPPRLTPWGATPEPSRYVPRRDDPEPVS